MATLHILDGSGYIFRAFYGIAGGGVQLSTKDGFPTGALFVFSRMLVRLCKDVDPKNIVVVFDAPGPSFRHELYEDYKANRGAAPDDLKKQMPFFEDLTRALGWEVISIPGVEADDVIATLTAAGRKAGKQVCIHSGDKDLMQLVEDEVTVVDSLRQKTYDTPAVVEKFGVRPNQVRDYLALLGDSSDNVPGMPGVGKKTAAKLLNEFGDIDGLLASTESLKGKQKEKFETPELLKQLALSRELVSLRTDVKGVDVTGDYAVGEIDQSELFGWFDRFEFFSLKSEIQEALLGGASEEQQSSPVDSKIELASFDADWLVAAKKNDKVAVHFLDNDGGVLCALASQGQAPVAGPVEEFKEFLESDEGPTFVVHDWKMWWHVLGRRGVHLSEKMFDTWLCGFMLTARRNPKLEELYPRYCETPWPGLRDDLSLLLAEQAVCLLSLSQKMKSALSEQKMEKALLEVDQPVTVLLAKMEQQGVALDTGVLEEQGERVGKRIAQLEESIHELAGRAFNVGSPKQLGVVLFDELGLVSPRMKKTKTGFSTNADVLESMKEHHPIVPAVLQWRELSKLKSTYLDALPPLADDKGRVHTEFSMATAATGRLASSNPNLQNIPIRTEVGRDIRRAFVAADGYELLSADYSQIELRVMAHMSGDPVLRRAFQEGIDIHSQTAAEVFDIPLEEVESSHRRIAKAVNYGLIYGQTDFGLGRALDIPRAEAKTYIDKYFERFSAVRTFMDQLVQQAIDDGGARTALGRFRPIPDLESRNFQRRKAAERMAQNTPIQGTAADIMKLSMLRVADAIVELPCTMLLTVHDELLFEVEKGARELCEGPIKTAMEGAFPMEVPLVVDTGAGADWASAH